jgi:2-dehydropantoate 2-reductase
MKFAIFGTGGVGGYFGGRLAQAGHDVTFIARGAHLAAITEAGLKVSSIDGDFVVYPAKATDDPASIGPVDVILVTVKAWQMEEALSQMSPLVGPKTLLLPMLNGVDAPEELAVAFGREHVLGGLCRVSSFIAEPGHIQHVGIQPIITLGELDDRRTERVETLREALSSISNATVEIPDDIHVALWEKFLIICALSGVGAVTRQPVGVYREVPETRAMFTRAIEETAAVGRARGIALSEDVVKRVLARVDFIQPDVIASMHKDILEGRPSELEAQTGAVVRMGRELGVSTPTHDFIYASLLPLELKARNRI